ncbi:VCBS repeat-containing protein [Micromonospora sp. 4G55]|nr:VCBS repeat-containing protein [Micromonospora sp. 4G55]
MYFVTDWRRRVSGVMAAVLASGLASVMAPAVAFAAVDQNVAPTLPGGAVLPIPSVPVSKATGTVGTLAGSGNVSPKGDYSYVLPLDVPAGRRGMQPHLALSYSSSAGEGAAGRGWAVSGLSQISRCGQSFASEGRSRGVKFNESDRFCLDGQKLVLVGSTDGAGTSYGADNAEYRTETDSFAKVTSFGGSLAGGPDGFLVSTKSGMTLQFDAVSATRKATAVSVTDSDNFRAWSDRVDSSGQVKAAWLLRSEKDQYGNEVRYSWDQPNPAAMEFYPQQITYTHGANKSAFRKVEFAYEGRTDVREGYVSGVKTALTKRLKRISMSAPNPSAVSQVWSYTLDYGDLSQSGRSMLRSVTKCGQASGCLRSKKFDYKDPSPVPAFVEKTIGAPLQLGTRDADYPDYDFSPNAAMRVADLNGDGLQDLLLNHSSTGGETRALLGTYQGSTPQPLEHGVVLSSAKGWPSATEFSEVRPLDLNGDGAQELMVPSRLSNAKVANFLKWDSAGEQFMSAGTGPNTAEVNEFADLDGDGLIDYLASDVATANTNDLDAFSARLNTGTANAFGNAPKLASSPLFTANYQSCPTLRATDVDGDGRAELVGHMLGTSGGADIEGCYDTDNHENFSKPSIVRLNDSGQLTSAEYSSQAAGQTERWYTAVPFLKDHDSLLGDVNGDGLTDVLMIPKTANFNNPGQVLINTGNGLVKGAEEDVQLNGRAPVIADINSDGRDDALWADRLGNLMLKLAGGSTVKLPQSVGYKPTMGDFDGDGKIDFAKLTLRDAAAGTFDLKVMTQNSFVDTDRLTQVYDAGSHMEEQDILYSTRWNDHPEENVSDYPTCGGFPSLCVRTGRLVVRQVHSRSHLVDLDPNKTATYRKDYAYEDPRYDLRGRGFLGFGTMRIWDRQRPAEYTYRYDLSTRVNNGKYYPGVGGPSEVFTVVPILTLDEVAAGVTTGVNTRVTHTTTTPTVTATSGVYRTTATQTETGEWQQYANLSYTSRIGSTQTAHVSGIDEAAATSGVRESTSQQNFNEYGNPTSGSTTNSSHLDEQTFTIGYDNRTNPWLINQPTRTAVTSRNNGEQLTRTSEKHYDAHGSLDTVYAEKDNPDTSLQQMTTLRYDSDGLLTATINDDDQMVGESSETGLPQRESRVEYAPVFSGQPDEKVYASQTWAKHVAPDGTDRRPSVWKAVHPALGVTVASVDINKVTSKTLFDDLGRPRTLKRPAGPLWTTPTPTGPTNSAATTAWWPPKPPRPASRPLPSPTP